jgi:hypothetical protein
MFAVAKRHATPVEGGSDASEVEYLYGESLHGNRVCGGDQRPEEVVITMNQARRFRTFATHRGYRAGLAVSTVIALVGSLGAPYKW